MATFSLDTPVLVGGCPWSAGVVVVRRRVVSAIGGRLVSRSAPGPRSARAVGRMRGHRRGGRVRRRVVVVGLGGLGSMAQA